MEYSDITNPSINIPALTHKRGVCFSRHREPSSIVSSLPNVAKTHSRMLLAMVYFYNDSSKNRVQKKLSFVQILYFC